MTEKKGLELRGLAETSTFFFLILFFFYRYDDDDDTAGERRNYAEIRTSERNNNKKGKKCLNEAPTRKRAAPFKRDERRDPALFHVRRYEETQPRRFKHPRYSSNEYERSLLQQKISSFFFLRPLLILFFYSLIRKTKFPNENPIGILQN